MGIMGAEGVLALTAGGLYAVASCRAVAHMRATPPTRGKEILTLAGLGAVALLGVLGVRAWSSGRFPAFGGLDAACWYALAVTLTYLYVGVRHEVLRTLSALLLPGLVGVVALGLASAGSGDAPTLRAQSPLLGLHVTCAFAGYGMFTVEGLLAVAYLVQDRSLKRKRLGGLAGRLPALETLDRVMRDLVGPAFLLFTLSIGLGIGLAYANQWGRRWAGDPKVLATGVTWLVFAALYYLRRRADRHGRRMAYVAVLGFACVVAAFLGVHMVTESLHDFGVRFP